MEPKCSLVRRIKNFFADDTITAESLGQCVVIGRTVGLVLGFIVIGISIFI